MGCQAGATVAGARGFAIVGGMSSRPSLLSAAALAVVLVPHVGLAQTAIARLPPGSIPRGAMVAVEQGGKAVAEGVLLGGDGRVLSALPPGGNTAALTLRFSDGKRVPARLGHADGRTGLVLLVPQQGKRLDGVRASEKDPLQERSRLWTSAGSAAGPALTAFQLPQGTLETASELGPLLAPVATPLRPGTPLFDAEGAVLGLATRLCLSTIPQHDPTAPPVRRCDYSAVAPIAVVRRVLAETPATATLPAVWLGLAGESMDLGNDRRGFRVTAVAPKSPAAKAKILGHTDPLKSDVLLRIGGTDIDSSDVLAAELRKYGPADRVPCVVRRAGVDRTVQVVLEQPPGQSSPPSTGKAPVSSGIPVLPP